MKKTIVLIILAILTIGIYKNNEYIEIPYNSIRFRVIANSNSRIDIQNKLIIKSALEEKFSEILKNKKTYEEIDNTINYSTDILKETINKVIEEKNIKTDYNVNYGINYYPEKNYKGLVYKSGNYKSYVVTLGEGKGDNFWCVLFPPLCLIPEKTYDSEYRFLIKDIISKYN